MEQYVRSEISSFRLHTLTLLALIYSATGVNDGNHYKRLIPLFCIQFIIGVFETVEVGRNSVNFGTMTALWSFTVYAVGVYPMVILLLGIVVYSIQWSRDAHELKRVNHARQGGGGKEKKKGKQALIMY